METTTILLVCCALAGTAVGQGMLCTVTGVGTGADCRPTSQCPQLLRLIALARSNRAVEQLLRELVRKCPRTAAGDVQICCQSEVTRTASPPRVDLPTETQCGHQFTAKVVGGEDAKIGEFPWMASIQYVETVGQPLRHGCGGTLITSRHVLTAAHCVTHRNSPKFPDQKPVSVVLGEFDFNSEYDCFGEEPTECADKPISVEIDAIFAHPDFENSRAQALPHDIAVVRLAREVTFTNYIRPICLLTDLSVLRGGRTDLSPGQNGIVAGWGRSSLDNRLNFTPVLQRARVPIRELEECEAKFTMSLPGRLCAGGGLQETDTCRGDSGGPLMVSANFGALIYQTGITSFGFSVCGNVAGYTRVFDYREWIIQQINK